MKKIILRSLAPVALMALCASPVLAAGDHVGPMKEIGKTKVAKWLNNPMVIEAIKAQNAKNASVGQADIDKMDKEWRAEAKAGGGKLISSVLSNALSKYLQKVKADSQGLYTEIFVMDNKGLNVGQSDVTSDYWQGDEAKWQKTYKVGPNAVLVGGVKTDESTQTLQSQLSLPVVDPANGQVIGAVTVGVNVEQLGQ